MDLSNAEDCIYIPITEYNRLKEIENAFILSQAQNEPTPQTVRDEGTEKEESSSPEGKNGIEPSGEGEEVVLPTSAEKQSLPARDVGVAEGSEASQA
jgi:hypothetical protein